MEIAHQKGICVPYTHRNSAHKLQFLSFTKVRICTHFSFRNSSSALGFETLLRRLLWRPRKTEQIPVRVCRSGCFFHLVNVSYKIFSYISEPAIYRSHCMHQGKHIRAASCTSSGSDLFFIYVKAKCVKDIVFFLGLCYNNSNEQRRCFL